MLKKDQPAPFQGVLITEKVYREFTLDSLELIDFKKHQDEYIGCNPDPIISGTDEKSFLIGGALGMLLTGLIWAFAAHH